jgi:hypothetical protein
MSKKNKLELENMENEHLVIYCGFLLNPSFFNRKLFHWPKTHFSKKYGTFFLQFFIIIYLFYKKKNLFDQNVFQY